MEKIIEGKIEYESKKYGFYYTNNILTLIPDENLEEVWKSMFKSLKERTVDDNLLLEGITSSGHRITFINIKLVRESGGIYKSFVPAYIIGNSNMINPLPVIDNFESMIFYGKCIDNFFDPQKVIQLENEDISEINMRLKSLKNDDILIENDKFNIGVSSTLSRTEKNTNTPVVLKSYLQINFENKKNITEVIEYHRKISELFEFLYLREYIKFNEIKLISIGKVKIGNEIKDITNTFDFYYYLPEEDKVDLPDINNCVKYEQIETHFKDLYLTLNNKKAYKNYYNLNRDDELKITINKYTNISSAFESWFDINFPKFKSDTNENYKILKDKVIKFIDDCIIEEGESDNKEILHLFKSDIEKLEGSLKEQIKYSLEMFKECIINVKKNLISDYNIKNISEEELNEKISNTFKNTRNRIAHGNMRDEILFSDMDVVAYVIVERLVQCLVLYNANIEIDVIKEIVDDKF